MKLKLELQDSPPHPIATLVVTETIEPSHIAVLKAGLTKLIQSGKKNIIIDLSAIQANSFTDATLPLKILEFRSWAGGLGAQVVVVSPIETTGHAKTRVDAVTMINSAEGPLLALEAKLQADLKSAQARKAVATQKLNQANASGDPKELRKMNSDLKRSIAQAEKLTQKFLKLRTADPYSLPAFQLAREALEEILASVLKKEGILS